MILYYYKFVRATYNLTSCKIDFYNKIYCYKHGEVVKSFKMCVFFIFLGVIKMYYS